MIARDSAWYEMGRSDPHFPELLKNCEDPPKSLWVWGNAEWWEWWSDVPRLAIIGSRRMSTYGKMAVHSLVPDLVARYRVKVVSGCALGVDSEAQVVALSSGGRVLGVIGGGFARLPARILRTFQSAVLDGTMVLLSEYPPDEPAQKWQFPRRNRLIAGLADGVVIIEAQRQSGTLITAGAALAAGKEVAVLTQPFQSPNVAGVVRLIERGAHLVATAEDVIEALFAHVSSAVSLRTGEQPKTIPPHLAQTPLEREIISILVQHSGRVEELAAQSECRFVRKRVFSLAEWQEALILLELRGVIIRDLGMMSFGSSV